MNILILGSGGREHALAWKIKQSPLCDKLFIAPGNAGTAEVGENIGINTEDFDAVADVIRKHHIGLLLVGPEAPLVAGIRDYFESQGEFADLRIIGPGKAGAELEGSKDYAKKFMARYDIPTAAYKTFGKGEVEAAKSFLREMTPPYVLKADGLAAGKGVVILSDLAEAEKEIEDMLAHAKFGEASARVVIEAFLDGIELSVFALTDGENYVLLPEAKDYKRIGEGDQGLNTGGMGAVSPVPFADELFKLKVVRKIVEPTIRGLDKDGINYVGFIFFGLIKVGDEPYVIEYNVRLGDPETEVVIPRLESDLLEMLIQTADGNLEGKSLKISEKSAATVMLVAGGYPEKYEKGAEITGIEGVKNALVFHAGTRREEGKVYTNGGRVIAITAFGDDMSEALKHSNEGAGQITFSGKYFRKDIGFDLK